MISRCTDCDIFVFPEAPFCFNCGLENPTVETFVRKQSKHTFSFTMVGTLIFATLITAIVATITYLEKPENMWQNIGCSFVTSLILGFVFALIAVPFVESRLAARAWRRSRNAPATDTLCKREDAAFEKISELVEELGEIESLQDDDHDPTNVDAVNEECRLAALESLNSIESQLYHLQIDEIALLRRKNNIYHIYKNLDMLDEEGIEESLTMIGESLEAIGYTEDVDPASLPAEDLAEHEMDEGTPEQEYDDAHGISIDDLFTYDHDAFQQRVDEYVSDFDRRADRATSDQIMLRDALLRRLKSLSDDIVPTSLDTPTLADAEKFASESAVREFDLRAREHAGLLSEVRREFDELNR